MIQRKTTLEAATTLVEGTVDEKLKQRYGTSVDEYMTYQHTKDIRKEIGKLRKEFEIINKEKNSYLTKEDLVEFFNTKTVKIIKYITQNIYIEIQFF
jgi:hypothetical protein